MVILGSTCKKEETDCILVKYLIYAVLYYLNFVVILHFLRQILILRFQSSQKIIYSKSAGGMPPELLNYGILGSRTKNIALNWNKLQFRLEN